MTTITNRTPFPTAAVDNCLTKMAHRHRLRYTFTLLLMLLTTQLCISPVQSRNIVQPNANELGPDDATDIAQSTELSDSQSVDNTAAAQAGDYLNWLEQSLLRKGRTLSRTFRNTEQRRVYSKRSGGQQVAKNLVTDEQLLEFIYRRLQNLVQPGAASSATANFRKRSAQTINTSANTRAAGAGNSKRPQIATGSFMSLCHFKICNMGKRSARSVALDIPAPSDRPETVE